MPPIQQQPPGKEKNNAAVEATVAGSRRLRRRPVRRRDGRDGQDRLTEPHRQRLGPPGGRRGVSGHRPDARRRQPAQLLPLTRRPQAGLPARRWCWRPARDLRRTSTSSASRWAATCRSSRSAMRVPSLKVKADDVFVCCPEPRRRSHRPALVAQRQERAGARQRAIAAQAGRDRPAHARSTTSPALPRLCTTRLDDAAPLGPPGRSPAIPRRDRELTTSHAAFGYLCREFGLRSITVQGLTTEENPEPRLPQGGHRDAAEARCARRVSRGQRQPEGAGQHGPRDRGRASAGALHAGTLPAQEPDLRGDDATQHHDDRRMRCVASE